VPTWNFLWGEAVSGPRTLIDLETAGLISIPYRGYRTGFEVTIKDATNLYISGGMLEVANMVITLAAQATVNTGALTADTLYYFYASLVERVLTFTISTTGYTYSHALGANYMTGDGTNRWLANVHTAA
jgi:hypothetical protein